ncbi:MAG TPA: T9SS type A sorting domain-containing protein [Candidatus Kapabacteria bacterium]|nr:T9SS type A sorting domain-containing protein [Candidatus Kapabacteria bacterium]
MKTKHFAFLLLSLSIAFQAAHGQGVVNGGAIGGSALPFLRHVTPMPEAPFSTLSSDVAISYFDPATPTHSWLIPSIWGSAEMIGLTQRITLSADSGYADSVRIVFDAISGDSVQVALDPDTVLFYSPLGEYYHLDATIFNTALNSFGDAVIYPSKLSSDTVTVSFPHIAVPTNFHVELLPSFSQQGSVTASFAVRGDSEATRARTVDNAHSTYLIVSGNSALSGVLDSNITPPPDTVPIFSNLYVTAYVSNAPSRVALWNASSNVSIFPNPASSSIQIQSAEAISRVELLDLLGRTVLSQKLSGRGMLDVSRLEPGRYEAILHTAGGVVARPVMITR